MAGAKPSKKRSGCLTAPFVVGAIIITLIAASLIFGREDNSEPAKPDAPTTPDYAHVTGADRVIVQRDAGECDTPATVAAAEAELGAVNANPANAYSGSKFDTMGCGLTGVHTPDGVKPMTWLIDHVEMVSNGDRTESIAELRSGPDEHGNWMMEFAKLSRLSSSVDGPMPEATRVGDEHADFALSHNEVLICRGPDEVVRAAAAQDALHSYDIVSGVQCGWLSRGTAESNPFHLHHVESVDWAMKIPGHGWISGRTRVAELRRDVAGGEDVEYVRASDISQSQN